MAYDFKVIPSACMGIDMSLVENALGSIDNDPDRSVDPYVILCTLVADTALVVSP